MGTIAIFPSLSRAPSMDSSESVEDDTIRDKMELGYVATRPRFTRARRSWNINHRNLTAEDVRVLRSFRDNVVLRGALPFYYPNLLSNASFESGSAPGSANLVEHWSAVSSPNISVSQTGAFRSAGQALLNQVGIDGTYLIVADLADQNPATCALTYDRLLPFCVGDVYLFTASVWNQVATQSQVASAGGSVILTLQLTYDDGSTATATASVPMQPAVLGVFFLVYGIQVTIPDAPAGSASITGSLQVSVTLAPSGTIPRNVWIDSCGLAKMSSRLPVMLMPGTNPITVPVRFGEGGLPKFADMGWANGVKRYGATFMLTEV